MADCIPSKDCIKVPIGEKCRKFCIERTLRTATPEEKRLILGYSNPTANAIYTAYQRYDIDSYDDLARHLTEEQEEEINAKFALINQFQLNYFQLDRRQRQLIIDAIKKLGLDMDAEEGPPLPA